jgi:PAS domain S-box-containing protein
MAAGLIVLAVSLHLVVGIHPRLRFILMESNQLETVTLSTYGFLALSGLVFCFCYRRWRKVTIDRRDLECVVGGLNHDVLMVVNPERLIIACNEAVSNVFGFDPEDILNKTTDVLYFDRRSKPGCTNEIFDQIEKVGYHVGFATGKKNDGSTMPLEIFTGKLRGRRGTVILLCDITERVENEQALRTAKEEAEESKTRAEFANEEKTRLLEKLQENYKELSAAESARDGLVHMVVHDMKLPLQVIKGYVELIKNQKAKGVSEIKDTYLNETLEQTHRLTSMVHSLLDVNRLEANEMPINLSPCNLNEAAHQSIRGMGELTDGKQILMISTADTNQIVCDPQLIGRTFDNLLNNAIQYSPSGGTVTLSIENLGEEVYVEITDQGPGVPEEHHETIFKKFGQIEGTKQKRKSSTGLGLTFCKLTIEAHNGAIGIRNHPEKGCVFWIKLPVKLALSDSNSEAA